jgi:hypothetical protein
MRNRFVLFATSLLGIAPVVAQVSALRGLVKNEVNETMSAVRSAMMDSRGAVRYETASTADGNYDFGPVEPDVYTVVIREPGFQEWRQTGVVVDEKKITFMDIRLVPHGWKPPKEKRTRSH